MDTTAVNRFAREMASLNVLFALTACGGGGADAAPIPLVEPPTTSPTPGPTPSPGARTLSLTALGAGSVTSAPAGISCSSQCSANFTDQAAVTLTATPSTNYAFTSWAGGCAGTSPTCTVTLDGNVAVTANFAPTVPMAGAPYVHYTDTLSAPTHGGEDNAGGYLSLFGTNFGAASGLGTTTKVYIGDVEVANYRYLGASKVSGKIGMQQLTVQVGSLAGAAVGVAKPIRVVVGGAGSNVDNTFTPTSGHVLFVSLTGKDSTAKLDDISHPFRSLQNMGTMTGAYFSMGAGDEVVIRGGNWSDANGVDTTWMRFGQGSAARNGTASAWIHITAYPGPVNGNAIEDVHYTTPAASSGGIAGPWSSIAGTSGEYVSVSNLRMEVAAGANRDAAPLNFQYTAGPWRVVNNELGPWVAGSSAVLNAAGVSGHGNGMSVLGNHIHNIAGTSDLQNHGVYADTTAQNWTVAYNWIHDVTGGSLIQFNDNEGGAGSYVLPHGGTWAGFTGIRINNNWLENAAKYGINFNDQGSTKEGTYDGQVWNNVIIGTALPPIRINSTQPVQTLRFEFNTIYDCMTTVSGSGNGMVRAEGWSSLSSVANKFYDNIFALGPHTASATQWFFDAGGTAATPATYDFKGNLYFAGGQKPDLPSTIGDAAAVIGDPLFTDAANRILSTQAKSPARKAASQALPSKFVIVDDFTGQVFRPVVSSDIGAFNAP
jgi:uncharacterized repeat protein (TIGR02543 family)